MSCVHCDSPVVAKGLCHKHYMRQRRHGGPTIVKQRGSRPSVPVMERMLAKSVEAPGPLSTPCLLFTGFLDKHGYGQVIHGSRTDGTRKRDQVPRVAWTERHGDPGHMFVLHHCDTPACFADEHLFLGDHCDNMADMASKGRARNRYTKVTAS